MLLILLILDNTQCKRNQLNISRLLVQQRAKLRTSFFLSLFPHTALKERSAIQKRCLTTRAPRHHSPLEPSRPLPPHAASFTHSPPAPPKHGGSSDRGAPSPLPGPRAPGAPAGEEARTGGRAPRRPLGPRRLLTPAVL